MDDRDSSHVGRDGDGDQVGVTDDMRAIFGRSYAAEPDRLVALPRADKPVAEADTLPPTVPNQLGVAYDIHVIESILNHVAPSLGRR